MLCIQHYCATFSAVCTNYNPSVHVDLGQNTSAHLEPEQDRKVEGFSINRIWMWLNQYLIWFLTDLDLDLDPKP